MAASVLGGGACIFCCLGNVVVLDVAEVEKASVETAAEVVEVASVRALSWARRSSGAAAGFLDAIVVCW